MSFVSLLVYVFINEYNNNYGWNTIFYTTLVERVSNPADLNLSVTTTAYLKAFTKGLGSAAHSLSFMSYIIITSVILWHHIKLEVFKNHTEYFRAKKLAALHYIGLGYVVFHFILFPVAWERFFIAQYTISLILLISLDRGLVTKQIERKLRVYSVDR